MDKPIKKRKTLSGEIGGVVATVVCSAVAGILANCTGVAFADVMLVAVFGLLMSNEFASEDKEVE